LPKSIGLLLLLITVSCTVFHSRLFILNEKGQSIDGLYIFPTIVAYENSKDLKREHYGENDFWVEIRVTDTLTKFPGHLLEAPQDDPELIEARANFRKRVISSFTVDSVIVHYQIPGEIMDSAGYKRSYLDKLITLPVVRDIPGWKWQLIFRFGNVEIPSVVENLRITIPYTNLSSTQNQFPGDTMSFTMHRYESHEKSLWAEDIPNNFR
jgi:hypothetical protein